MPKNNNISSYANETLPTELRDAVVLGENYAITTFKDQFYSDIETLFMVLEAKYQEYIKFFEDKGGRIKTTKEENKTLFTLGTSAISVYWRSDMTPRRIIHDFDFDTAPISESDTCAILNAIIAISYRDTTDKAIMKVRMSRKDLVNKEMVNGFEEIAIRIHTESKNIVETLRGSNVQKEDVDGL